MARDQIGTVESKKRTETTCPPQICGRQEDFERYLVLLFSSQYHGLLHVRISRRKPKVNYPRPAGVQRTLRACENDITGLTGQRLRSQHGRRDHWLREIRGKNLTSLGRRRWAAASGSPSRSCSRFAALRLNDVRPGCERAGISLLCTARRAARSGDGGPPFSRQKSPPT